MEKETKKSVATKAEKKDATRNLIKEVLMKKEYKHNDLIEEAAKLYVERFDNETDNINDVKGRVGSVLDIMKKEQDVNFEGGMYALNVKTAETPTEEKKEKEPKKTTRKTKKTEEKAESVETAEKKEKSKTTKAKKEKASPLPPAPIQPIAPVAPTTPEAEPTPVKETKPKKQTKRAKKQDEAEVKTGETVIEKETSQTLEEKVVLEALEEVKQTLEEKAEVLQEKTEEIVPEQKVEAESKKQEVATVMDMSFLFGSPKPTKTETKSEVKVEAKEEQKKEQKKEAVPQEKEETKKEELKAQPQPKKQEKAEQPQKPVKVEQPQKRKTEKPVVKGKTADEKLCEAFLKKIRSLGGDYFEYYSVYLLEKYSRKNGRRLESLRITAGDHDGGIDGEIELTDRLGFRETIYIQSKNWNPEKGDEKLWVVGETLLQQFIGACACRQAKDGKQNCRGIFITTSRFTPEAKRILEDMSDKIVGYDGEDLYEAAKESEFGIVKKNGEWTLDERLLSGEKAFFNML